MSPPSLAVLGGGLTGLSAAFHLARTLPRAAANIVLLERTNRLGGWLNSASALDGQVTLEAGPRSIRPNSLALLELASAIHLLQLESAIVSVPKSDAASKKRYLLLPPLTLLPSSIPSLLASTSDPALKQLVPSVVRETFTRPNRPKDLTDESVYAFVARRFGDEFARQYLTSIVHGIYAADARQLSVRAAFPFLWEAEDRGNGSVMRGIIKSLFRTKKEPQNDYDTGVVTEKIKDASMYTFQGGIETLSNALRRDLLQRDNVKIIQDFDATAIRALDAGVEVSSNSDSHAFSHVISTIPPTTLHSLNPSPHIPHLNTNPSSTVLVINLVFPATHSGAYLHPPGFGYLIPRPASDYPSHPPSNANLSDALLGVIFDSAIQTAGEKASQMTRLTLMLGGPYPLPPSVVSFASSHPASSVLPPSAVNELLPPLLRTLEKHLSSSSHHVTFPEPLEARMVLQKDCIPTYTPGHPERINEMRKILLSDGRDGWGGRLSIVGAGVSGVSLGDCVEAGRTAARDVADCVLQREA